MTLFFTKDKLQLQMQLPTSIHWKSLVPMTFLDHQSGLNFCSEVWSSPSSSLLKWNQKYILYMMDKGKYIKPVRDISFPSASFSLIIKLSRTVVNGLWQNNTFRSKNLKLKTCTTAFKKKLDIQCLQGEVFLAPSLIILFPQGNCIKKNTCKIFFSRSIISNIKTMIA